MAFASPVVLSAVRKVTRTQICYSRAYVCATSAALNRSREDRSSFDDSKEYADDDDWSNTRRRTPNSNFPARRSLLANDDNDTRQTPSRNPRLDSGDINRRGTSRFDDSRGHQQSSRFSGDERRQSSRFSGGEERRRPYRSKDGEERRQFTRFSGDERRQPSRFNREERRQSSQFNGEDRRQFSRPRDDDRRRPRFNDDEGTGQSERRDRRFNNERTRGSRGRDGGDYGRPRFGSNDNYNRPQRSFDRNGRPRFGAIRDQEAGEFNYRSYGNEKNDPEELSEIQQARASGDDLLYGLQSVKQALEIARRSPHTLYLQESSSQGSGSSGERKPMNERLRREIESLGNTKSLRIVKLNRGDMNSLCGSRPHQGAILRCSSLEYTLDDESALSDPKLNDVILALDEVRDPQNLGALIRTASFLGTRSMVVCAKNSAPLSAVVSRASAGSAEVVSITSTDSMPRFLRKAKLGGWRILGTASSGIQDESIDIRNIEKGPPTILVLGSEGDGLRTMVRNCCDETVEINRAENTPKELDSLNVSVAGALALFQLLR